MSARGSDVSRALRRRAETAARQSEAAARRPRSLRGRLVLASLLLLLFGVVAGAVRLYTSGYFDLRDLRVSGTVHLSDDAVREASALTGQSYFLVDPAEAAARVKALPWVRDARVQRRFPHSASVTVTERTPLGVWRVGAIAYLVDQDGVVLDTLSGNSAEVSLPVVDASGASQDVQIGGHIDPDPLRVAASLATSPAGSVGRSVVQLQYDQIAGLTAITDKGVHVYLGDGQDLDYKLAVWQATIAAAPAGDVHELDLRVDNRPFYR